MNEILQRAARDYLKENLDKLSEPEWMLFKRMYSPKNLGKPIDQVVEEMPEDRLDWAMTQVWNTLKKKEKKDDYGQAE